MALIIMIIHLITWIFLYNLVGWKIGLCLSVIVTCNNYEQWKREKKIRSDFLKSSLLAFSLLLVSCSSETPVAVEQLQYKEGDQICLKVGSSTQFVLLLEDVEPGRFAAFAKYKNGNTGIVDLEYIVEYSECIE